MTEVVALDVAEAFLRRVHALEAVAAAARVLYDGHIKFRDEDIEEGKVPSSEDIYNFARMIMDHIPDLRDALAELDKGGKQWAT